MDLGETPNGWIFHTESGSFFHGNDLEVTQGFWEEHRELEGKEDQRLEDWGDH